MQLEPAPMIWEPELLDSKLEADLTRSIANARSGADEFRPVPPPPRFNQTEQPIRQANSTPTAFETVESSSLAQLVGGCGIAVVDGYLHMKEYAATKGLDLAEMHHKGIDAQDLISTLLINCQRKADQESGAKRWKRQ